MVKHSDFQEIGWILRVDTSWYQLLDAAYEQEPKSGHYYIARDDEATDRIELYVARVDSNGAETTLTLDEYTKHYTVPETVWKQWREDFLPSAVACREYYVDGIPVLETPRPVVFKNDCSWEPVNPLPVELAGVFEQSNIVHATYYASVDYARAVKDEYDSDQRDDMFSILGIDVSKDTDKLKALTALETPVTKIPPSTTAVKLDAHAEKAAEIYALAHPQTPVLTHPHATPTPSHATPPPPQVVEVRNTL